MQRRYLSQPSIQAQLDNLILMRLQEQLNPEINEQLLSEKLLEEFAADFKELCGIRFRPLEEVIEWFFLEGARYTYHLLFGWHQENQTNHQPRLPDPKEERKTNKIGYSRF